MQSMQSACRHPVLNASDTENGESASDTYATRHNPFVYFHSITDSPACASNVVNLSALPGDLGSVATTPNYAFIIPDVCADGHDSTCPDHSRPGGYQGINNFLSTSVPQITSCAAYKQDGLLAVIFDESAGDRTACCGEIAGPNAAQPGNPGAGGGQTGAVLVSPFIAPGTTSSSAYNHYSLLASIEDLFGLGRLGMAGVSGLPTFGADVYNKAAAPAPGSTPTPIPMSPGAPSAPTPKCPSGRSVTIRLPTGKKHLRKASVKVNGHAVKITGGKRPRAVINLVGLPGTTVTVVITGRSGKHAYHSVRRYRPCHV